MQILLKYQMVSVTGGQMVLITPTFTFSLRFSVVLLIKWQVADVTFSARSSELNTGCLSAGVAAVIAIYNISVAALPCLLVY